MLKTTLNLNNVDINKFTKLIAFLKCQSVGYMTKNIANSSVSFISMKLKIFVGKKEYFYNCLKM